jgi:hypothetical protein
MLRKTILAGAAAMTLAGAALAPNSASAWVGHPGWHGGYHGWHRAWFYRPGVRVCGPIYGGCFHRRLVGPTTKTTLTTKPIQLRVIAAQFTAHSVTLVV